LVYYTVENKKAYRLDFIKDSFFALFD